MGVAYHAYQVQSDRVSFVVARGDVHAFSYCINTTSEQPCLYAYTHTRCKLEVKREDESTSAQSRRARACKHQTGMNKIVAVRPLDLACNFTPKLTIVLYLDTT